MKTPRLLVLAGGVVVLGVVSGGTGLAKAAIVPASAGTVAVAGAPAAAGAPNAPAPEPVAPGEPGAAAPHVGGEPATATEPAAAPVAPAREPEAPGTASAAIPDRGIPALSLPAEDPPGDAWRAFAPPSGPLLTGNLSPSDKSQTRANLRFLLQRGGVSDERPFTRRHAAAILAGLSSDQHELVRRSTLITIGRLSREAHVDPEIRELFRQAILDYLAAEQPGLAAGALRAVDSTGLAQDPRVLAKVREIAMRSVPEGSPWGPIVRDAQMSVWFAQNPR